MLSCHLFIFYLSLFCLMPQLDEALAQMLLDRVSRVLRFADSRWLLTFQPEVAALLRFLVFRATVWRHVSAVGPPSARPVFCFRGTVAHVDLSCPTQPPSVSPCSPALFCPVALCLLDSFCSVLHTFALRSSMFPWVSISFAEYLWDWLTCLFVFSFGCFYESRAQSGSL